jgi:hypothetical protein
VEKIGRKGIQRPSRLHTFVAGHDAVFFPSPVEKRNPAVIEHGEEVLQSPISVACKLRHSLREMHRQCGLRSGQAEKGDRHCRLALPLTANAANRAGRKAQ